MEPPNFAAAFGPPRRRLSLPLGDAPGKLLAMQLSGYRFVPFPFVVLAAVFLITRGQPWTLWRTLGFAMMVFGFAFWAVAHVQLGDAFSVRPEARHLVTGGLYARFRSPIYLFGSIGIAGCFLALEKPLWLLAFLVLIPVQIVRTRREGQVLEEKFGDEYRQYVRQTWI
jgi:protein-S-isoprenylcysteine O-methyltransferase Ste14